MTEEEADYLANVLPRVDFEYPDDDNLALVAAYAGLIAWAGASRARHAVIGALLKQDKRSQGALARAVVVSKQAIAAAMREGRAEIERLTRRASI